MVGFKKDTDKKALKTTDTQCPRCKVAFICNAADIKQCQCYDISLQIRDLEYLQQQGFNAETVGCLCRKCLLEMQCRD